MATYLLWGENTFASTQKRREIMNRYIQKHGALNSGIFEAADLTIERYRDVVDTMPLLATTRLVMIINAISEAKPVLKEYIERTLAKISSDTVVIFHEIKLPDRRSKLFKLLNQPKQAQYFAAWDKPTTIAWLAQQAKGLGGELRTKIAQYLVDRTGLNPWLLDQELKKLITFSPLITQDMIDKLTPITSELSTWAIIDALQTKSPITFLNTCDQLQTKGDAPQYLISLINAGLRQIALVVSQAETSMSVWQVAKQTGLPTFVVQKIQQSSFWNLNRVKRAYHQLADLDTAIKLGTIEPSVALDVFAIKALAPASNSK